MAQTPCFCFLPRVRSADAHHFPKHNRCRLQSWGFSHLIHLLSLPSSLPISLLSSPPFSGLFSFLSLVSNFPDEEVRFPLHPPFAFQAWYSSWNHSSPTFANWAAGTGDLESGSGWVPHALAEKRRAPAYGVLREKCGRAKGNSQAN